MTVDRSARLGINMLAAVAGCAVGAVIKNSLLGDSRVSWFIGGVLVGLIIFFLFALWLGGGESMEDRYGKDS